ncbi:N-6 DNA methylase [Streptomyces boncukensis]|uniref:N-6 DNA methylase n=1 Tax=Streptomyces boncukensis TaxID=2711219 RepID=A0A6G4X773_9ACTN|nr:N-6 DNA methylase [Streptomyces boncukensis]
MADNAADNAADSAAEVTAAEIARLAGVGRAAVSNWRRRYPHFPRPVGGTETSPSFSLPEVEYWLRAHGRLAELPLRERVWQRIEADPEGTAAAVLRAGERMLQLAEHAGRADADAAAEPDTEAPADDLARLAGELGPHGTYAFLLSRHLDANSRQYTLTPPDTAALMASLAAGATSVLDPACGSGELLAAALAGAAAQRSAPQVHTLLGQETDPDLARLSALRLTLRGAAHGTAVHIRAEDALRTEPAESEPPVDAVLCHPPFNERNWGHDELAYDPRWVYGLPARTESELAWAQHALARLRPGGTAVLLMPPAAASRRTGRRIRAALLRKGALRAVLALPAGAAAPHSLPLHLWVLRKPGAAPSQPQLLLMDTSDRFQGASRGTLPWPELTAAVLSAWRAFDEGGTVPEEPGVCGVLSVIDLLDDDVDLSPPRHLPPAGDQGGGTALAEVHSELEQVLRRTLDAAPSPALPAASGAAAQAPQGAPAALQWTDTTIGDLARGGALEVRTAGSEAGSVTTEPGDVVLPVQGRGAAYVVEPEQAGETLAKPLSLLRVDPAALDPWFVAGFLRSTANTRQASSYASSTARIDVRRLRLPRLPLRRQRQYGQHFRRLAAFEAGLRRAGALGEQLVQGVYDGLAQGTIPPE